jgi:hypothetical protein
LNYHAVFEELIGADVGIVTCASVSRTWLASYRFRCTWRTDARTPAGGEQAGLEQFKNFGASFVQDIGRSEWCNPLKS